MSETSAFTREKGADGVLVPMGFGPRGTEGEQPFARGAGEPERRRPVPAPHHLDLVLAAAGVLGGQVIDEEGAPLGGGFISAKAVGLAFSGGAKPGPDGRFAIGALIEDLYGHQADLTARAVTDDESGFEAWMAAHGAEISHLDSLVTEILQAPAPDLAMLTVANRHLRALVAA